MSHHPLPEPPRQGTPNYQQLESRVIVLEAKLNERPRAFANPHSWFFSDSLLKRSFAVLGHYMLASLIIGREGPKVAYQVSITGLVAPIHLPLIVRC